MVKKQPVINQATSGTREGQSDLTSLPAIGQIKCKPICEISSDPIRLQPAPKEQCGRNRVQPESISRTGQINNESNDLQAVQDQLVKLKEIIQVDDTDEDVQTDQRSGYIVEKLNPYDTIQEDPPQELVADCRVLLIKHLPPAWNMRNIQEFVIANTSAVSIVTKYFVLAPPKSYSTHGL